MADKLTPEQRSAHMARIRRSDTKPEKRVRSLLHGLGYRFRIQLKGVPGRPDVALTRRRIAIMVHGCFWHAHGCASSNLPKTRTDFWAAKFAANKARDARLQLAAEKGGWRCIVIWECETNDIAALAARLRDELGPPCLSDIESHAFEGRR